MRKSTKIIATLGPSCETEEMITKLVEAGMNVARLNFSHGTYENHADLITRVRAVEQKTGEPVAILQDLQGPKIRLGVLPEAGVELKKGSTVIFDTAAESYDGTRIPVGFHELHEHVKKGERLLLADGKMETTVLSVTGTQISALVDVGGFVTSHKGINIPDSDIHIPALTDKDKEDLQFGLAHGVDLVALSFVKTAADVQEAKDIIAAYQKEHGEKDMVRVIAKIERHEAVVNIHDILRVADGIMVARGDLGVEIRAAEVPLVQKRLIELALEEEKPVIVATQMLDSMQENPRPTRAEVSDVANAVIDHTDAVMLSNETATGKFPVEAVAMMAEIALEIERSHYDDLPFQIVEHQHQHHVNIEEVVSEMSRMLAERVHAKAMVAASFTGDTGRALSSYRPQLPMYVATLTNRVQRQLNLSWGVVPFLMTPCTTIEELVAQANAYLKTKKVVDVGDGIVIVAGEPVGKTGKVNLLEVRQVI